ncbi:hypothetical protein NDN08_006900 [Rhodosorus marinus]|uniref:Uncharacterized protein n=1 Tax=Rhodosorus marinus TaxID=101924 RepID=A0AAV8UMX2_9RHOD|nr:hypothetical protein NDN08_006900 [Rhodosorus marinus]
MDQAFVVVPAVRAKSLTTAQAKKKGRRAKGRSVPKPPPIPSDFVSSRVGDDDGLEEEAGAEGYKSKLTPLSGTPENPVRSRGKKRPVGKEPEAIKIAKQATWFGIGALVFAELFVHLVWVRDWIPKGN